MLTFTRSVLEVVKEGRISNFLSGHRRFEFANIIYDEKSIVSERILAQ